MTKYNHQNDSWFKECIDPLGSNASILSFNESKKIKFILQRVFPFISSNIKWEIVDKKTTINSGDFGKIINSLERLLKKSLENKSIYVMWDTGFHDIKTDLNSAILYFDDLSSIGTRTWLFASDFGYVVEWHWCGNKTVGLASPERIDLGEKWKSLLDGIENNLKILNPDHSEGTFKLLKNKFGFRNVIVDWNIITSNTAITSETEIIASLMNLLSLSPDKSVYLLWEDKELPVLETNLDLVILNWDKMLRLSNKIWIFNQAAQYIIEVQNNKILIGVPPVNRNINK